jgi:hypothetical protein
MNPSKFYNRSNKVKTLCLFATVTLGAMACSVNDASQPDESDLYVSIPDSQFEQRLIDQGIDSEGTLDKRILKTDAEDITSLDLNWSAKGEEIRSLEGIEGFANLTNLSVAQQELEHVDLRSNTKLNTLYMPGNFIQAIDLSHNTHLLEVNLSSNNMSKIEGLSELNRLKTLDLSFNYFEDFSTTNASVEIIYLNVNDLEKIEISQAQNLRSLVVTSNKLSEINIADNTKLEIVIMSDNNIQSVDLSKNQELQYFYASSNILKNLDVSFNTKLIDLRVNKNPNLTCIKIQPGQEVPILRLADNQELKNECAE